MEIRAVWQSLEESATQYLDYFWSKRSRWIDESEGGVHNMVSEIIGTLNGEPLVANSVISLDSAWRVRRFNVWVRSHDVQVCMNSDGIGNWIGSWDRKDPPDSQSDLAGSIDIDINVTPITNTIPIRRLKLTVGESSEIDVAYISVPDLNITRRRQRYTRLSDRTFRYESLEDGEAVFAADVNVDGFGLVIDYPGLFKRLYPVANGS